MFPTHYGPRPASPPGGVYRYQPLPERDQQDQQQGQMEYPANYDTPPGYPAGPNPPPQYDPLGRPQAGTFPGGPAAQNPTQAFPGAQAGLPTGGVAPGQPPFGSPADPSPDGWGHTDPLGQPYAWGEQPVGYDGEEDVPYHHPAGQSPLEVVMQELQDAFQILGQLGPQNYNGPGCGYAQYGEEPADEFDEDQYSPEDIERMRQERKPAVDDREYRARQIEADRQALEARRNRRQMPPHYEDDDFPLPYEFDRAPTLYAATHYADPNVVREIQRVYRTLKAAGGGRNPVTAHQVRALLPREMQAGAVDAMREMMRQQGYEPPTGRGGLPEGAPTHPVTKRPYVPLEQINRPRYPVMPPSPRPGEFPAGRGVKVPGGAPWTPSGAPPTPSKPVSPKTGRPLTVPPADINPAMTPADWHTVSRGFSGAPAGPPAGSPGVRPRRVLKPGARVLPDASWAEAAGGGPGSFGWEHVAAKPKASDSDARTRGAAGGGVFGRIKAGVGGVLGGLGSLGGLFGGGMKPTKTPATSDVGFGRSEADEYARELRYALAARAAATPVGGNFGTRYRGY